MIFRMFLVSRVHASWGFQLFMLMLVRSLPQILTSGWFCASQPELSGEESQTPDIENQTPEPAVSLGVALGPFHIHTLVGGKIL